MQQIERPRVHKTAGDTFKEFLIWIVTGVCVCWVPNIHKILPSLQIPIIFKKLFLLKQLYRLSFLFFPSFPQLTCYIVLEQYPNQEIGTGTLLLTRLQTSFIFQLYVFNKWHHLKLYSMAESFIIKIFTEVETNLLSKYKFLFTIIKTNAIKFLL